MTLILILLPAYLYAEIPSPYLKVSVILQGLEPNLENRILTGLSIKAAENEPKLTRDRIELLSELGQEEVIQRLEALGYYQSQVDYQLIANVKTQPQTIQVRYNVKRGSPTYIGNIHIEIIGEGKDHPALEAIRQYPTLFRGMQLEHKTYEDYKEELLGKALQLGYLNASFSESAIQINAPRNRADIILKLDTGKRFIFGIVSFVDAHYPDCYLERYVPFRTGDPYTTEQISNLQKALWASDLFRRVRVYPDTNNIENYSVPIEVRLKDKPLNTYTVGVGYGNETGFRGNVGWDHRLTSFPGHRLSTQLRGSKKRNRANILYSIPGLDPTAEQLLLESAATAERFKGKSSKRWDNSITKIIKCGSWERIQGLHYLIEVFREDSKDPKQHTHFLFPTLGYIWRNIQKTTPFSHGVRVLFTTKGAVRSLASSTSFAQAELEPKWAILLGECARLILRGDLGATFVQNHKLLPLSLRFFAGGEDSVRGYQYNDLGPKERNASGKEIVVGGRYLLVGSVEIERLIYGHLSSAVFVDAGNAMNRFNDPLRVGAGVGVRWATPLGPFKLDIAHPVRKGKFRPRFYLSFGVDF